MKVSCQHIKKFRCTFRSSLPSSLISVQLVWRLFDFRHGEEIFFLNKGSDRLQGPSSLPFIKYITWALSLGIKWVCGKLTICQYPVSRLRMSGGIPLLHHTISWYANGQIYHYGIYVSSVLSLLQWFGLFRTRRPSEKFLIPPTPQPH